MAEPNKIKASLIGFDNLIEDIFGLNAKAFRTIWESFKAPKTYTIAAGLSDWGNRFTPSARVWIGLVALYSALRFFYGSEDGAMTKMYVEMFEQTIEQNPNSPIAGVDVNLFAQSLMKWTFLFFPIIMLPLYALIAFVFRVWPDKPSFVVRFRYIMLTLVPGTAFMTLVTIAFIFVKGSLLEYLMIFSVVGLILLDGITAYRGTFHQLDSGNRIGLSIVLTILLFGAFFVGSTLTAIPAGVAAMMELRP